MLRLKNEKDRFVLETQSLYYKNSEDDRKPLEWTENDEVLPTKGLSRLEKSAASMTETIADILRAPFQEQEVHALLKTAAKAVRGRNAEAGLHDAETYLKQILADLNSDVQGVISHPNHHDSLTSPSENIRTATSEVTSDSSSHHQTATRHETAGGQPEDIGHANRLDDIGRGDHLTSLNVAESPPSVGQHNQHNHQPSTSGPVLDHQLEEKAMLGASQGTDFAGPVPSVLLRPLERRGNAFLPHAVHDDNRGHPWSIIAEHADSAEDNHNPPQPGWAGQYTGATSSQASNQMLAIISAAAAAATTAAASAMRDAWMPPNLLLGRHRQDIAHNDVQRVQGGRPLWWASGPEHQQHPEQLMPPHPRRVSSPEPLPHPVHTRLVTLYPQPLQQRDNHNASGLRVVRLGDPMVSSKAGPGLSAGRLYYDRGVEVPSFQDLPQESPPSEKQLHTNVGLISVPVELNEQQQHQQPRDQAGSSTATALPVDQRRSITIQEEQKAAGRSNKMMRPHIASDKQGQQNPQQDRGSRDDRTATGPPLPPSPPAGGTDTEPAASSIFVTHGIVPPKVRLPKQAVQNSSTSAGASETADFPGNSQVLRADTISASAPNTETAAAAAAPRVPLALPPQLQASVSHALEVIRNPDLMRGQQAAAYPPVMDRLELQAAENITSSMLGGVFSYSAALAELDAIRRRTRLLSESTAGADHVNIRDRSSESLAAAAPAPYVPNAAWLHNEQPRKISMTEAVPPVHHPWEDEDGWDDLQVYQRAMEREVAYRAVSGSRAKIVPLLQQQKKQSVGPTSSAPRLSGIETAAPPSRKERHKQGSSSVAAAAVNFNQSVTGKAPAAGSQKAAAAGFLPPRGHHAQERSTTRISKAAADESKQQPELAGRSRSVSPLGQGRPKPRPTTVAFGRKVEAAMVRPAARASRRATSPPLKPESSLLTAPASLSDAQQPAASPQFHAAARGALRATRGIRPPPPPFTPSTPESDFRSSATSSATDQLLSALASIVLREGSEAGGEESAGADSVAVRPHLPHTASRQEELLRRLRAAGMAQQVHSSRNYSDDSPRTQQHAQVAASEPRNQQHESYVAQLQSGKEAAPNASLPPSSRSPMQSSGLVAMMEAVITDPGANNQLPPSPYMISDRLRSPASQSLITTARRALPRFIMVQDMSVPPTSLPATLPATLPAIMGTLSTNNLMSQQHPDYDRLAQTGLADSDVHEVEGDVMPSNAQSMRPGFFGVEHSQQRPVEPSQGTNMVSCDSVLHQSEAGVPGEQEAGFRGDDWERQEERVLDMLVDEVMGQVLARAAAKNQSNSSKAVQPREAPPALPVLLDAALQEQLVTQVLRQQLEEILIPMTNETEILIPMANETEILIPMTNETINNNTPQSQGRLCDVAHDNGLPQTEASEDMRSQNHERVQQPSEPVQPTLGDQEQSERMPDKYDDIQISAVASLGAELLEMQEPVPDLVDLNHERSGKSIGDHHNVDTASASKFSFSDRDGSLLSFNAGQGGHQGVRSEGLGSEQYSLDSDFLLPQDSKLSSTSGLDPEASFPTLLPEASGGLPVPKTVAYSAEEEVPARPVPGQGSGRIISTPPLSSRASYSGSSKNLISAVDPASSAVDPASSAVDPASSAALSPGAAAEAAVLQQLQVPDQTQEAFSPPTSAVETAAPREPEQTTQGSLETFRTGGQQEHGQASYAMDAEYSTPPTSVSVQTPRVGSNKEVQTPERAAELCSPDPPATAPLPIITAMTGLLPPTLQVPYPVPVPFPALYPTPVLPVSPLSQYGTALTSTSSAAVPPPGPMLTYILPPAVLARAASRGGLQQKLQQSASPELGHDSMMASPSTAVMMAQAQASAALAAARGAGGLRDTELPLGRFCLPGLEQILADSSTEFDFRDSFALRAQPRSSPLWGRRDLVGRPRAGVDRRQEDLERSYEEVSMEAMLAPPQQQQLGGKTSNIRSSSVASAASASLHDSRAPKASAMQLDNAAGGTGLYPQQPSLVNPNHEEPFNINSMHSSLEDVSVSAAMSSAEHSSSSSQRDYGEGGLSTSNNVHVPRRVVPLVDLPNNSDQAPLAAVQKVNVQAVLPAGPAAATEAQPQSESAIPSQHGHNTQLDKTSAEGMPTTTLPDWQAQDVVSETLPSWRQLMPQPLASATRASPSDAVDSPGLRTSGLKPTAVSSSLREAAAAGDSSVASRSKLLGDAAAAASGVSSSALHPLNAPSDQQSWYGAAGGQPSGIDKGGSVPSVLTERGLTPRFVTAVTAGLQSENAADLQPPTLSSYKGPVKKLWRPQSMHSDVPEQGSPNVGIAPSRMTALMRERGSAYSGDAGGLHSKEAPRGSMYWADVSDSATPDASIGSDAMSEVLNPGYRRFRAQKDVRSTTDQGLEEEVGSMQEGSEGEEEDMVESQAGGLTRRKNAGSKVLQGRLQGLSATRKALMRQMRIQDPLLQSQSTSSSTSST